MKFNSISIFNFEAKHTQFAHLSTDELEVIYYTDLEMTSDSLG